MSYKFFIIIILILNLLSPVKAKSQEIQDSNSIFSKGTGETYVYFQYGNDFNFHTYHIGCHYGFGYYLKDGLSFNGEIGGLYISQSNYKGENTGGINCNIILRYHILREDNFSFYIDGGAGILATTEFVTENGRRFNFSPQVGIGTTIKINDENRIMIGARYFHTSNLNDINNPGRDTIIGYCGIIWRK